MFAEMPVIITIRSLIRGYSPALESHGYAHQQAIDRTVLLFREHVVEPMREMEKLSTVYSKCIQQFDALDFHSAKIGRKCFKDYNEKLAQINSIFMLCHRALLLLEINRENPMLLPAYPIIWTNREVKK